MTVLEVGKCALLLMDLQNEIVHRDGFVGGQGMAAEAEERHVVENSTRALHIARLEKIPVFHVGMAFRSGYPDVNARAPIFQGIMAAGALLDGSWGAQFLPQVRPLEGEPIVFKRGVGAFAGTDLRRMLQVLAIETLVLAGVATNFVVEATARQAVDEGFRVITLRDCCATFNGAMHDNSLGFLSFLGAVVTVDEFAIAARSHSASGPMKA
jgi:nicotinamidase-related amidase